MPQLEDYKGREQTFLKHYFLEHYLERVAFKIGSWKSEFVYVDGFSGPWESTGDNYSDTSFSLAVQKLRYVQDGLKKINPNLKIRCLFIEKNPKSFKKLKERTKTIDDLEAEAIPGEFEDAIPDIMNFIGNSFSLIFIDPKGWKGYQLNKIKPLLRLPGEILINFMFNRINQFIKNSIQDLLGNLDRLPEYNKLINNGISREDATLSIYIDSFKKAGDFPYVASTPILMPNINRLYFHLIYGTRHIEGLREFRKVEEKLFNEQTQVRGTAQHRKRIEDSGQAELFDPEDLPYDSKLLQDKRTANIISAKRKLDSLIKQNSKIQVLRIFEELLESTFLWEKDIKDWIMELNKSGKIEILNMDPSERTIKPEHIISLKV